MSGTRIVPILATLLLLLCGHASAALYSINGTDDLSVAATYQHWSEDNYMYHVADGVADQWDGWWSGTSPSKLLIKFNDGITNFDKIQIDHGRTGYTALHADQFALYYTTDTLVFTPNTVITDPMLTYTFNPVSILDSMDTNISATEFSGNAVDLNAFMEEDIMLEIAPVSATGILLVSLDSTVFNEIAFEATDIPAPAVPEPLTLTLTIFAVSSLCIRKRQR